jgi:hypothetical protein
MVKKLEKGATVTCYKCHGEGHKFYKCPQFVKKMDKGAKKKLNPTIKSSLIYTKPNRKNKTKSNTFIIKKKANGKVVAHKVGKMKEERGWNQPIWVPKEVIIVGGIRNQAFRIPKIKECLSLPKLLCEKPSSKTPGALESFLIFQNLSFGPYPSSPVEPSNELRITQGIRVLLRLIIFFCDETPGVNLAHLGNLG